MTSERWFTKRDVIRDLNVVSGGRTRFDNNCVVIGEQPPPRLMCDDAGTEQVSEFSGIYKCKPDIAQGPDLAGITKMLRAVEHFNQLSQKESAPKPVEVDRPKDNTVIVISKLNPAAAEFKPKDCLIVNNTAKSQYDATEINRTSQNIKCDVKFDEKNEKAISHITDSPSDNVASNENNTILKNIKSTNKALINKEVNIVESNKENVMENNKTDSYDANNQIGSKDYKLNEKEILEKQKKELKDKVSGTINTNCVKVKKERNIAMIALMKLYSLPQKSTQEPEILLPPASSQEPVKLASIPAQEEPVKNFLARIQESTTSNPLAISNETVRLFPPAYFESSFKDKTKVVQQEHEIKYLDIPIAMDLVVLDDNLKSPDVVPIQNKIHCDNINVSVKMSENTDDTSVTLEVDSKDIEESVEKVNRWLNSVESNGDIKENEKDTVVKTKEKPKMSKAPFLGTVTFKRKQIKSQSPNSSADTSETVTNKKSASPGPYNMFVPSEYANKLRKHYTEQAKAKKLATEDMWTRIENEMKEKENNINREITSTECNS